MPRAGGRVSHHPCGQTVLLRGESCTHVCRRTSRPPHPTHASPRPLSLSDAAQPARMHRTSDAQLTVAEAQLRPSSSYRASADSALRGVCVRGRHHAAPRRAPHHMHHITTAIAAGGRAWQWQVGVGRHEYSPHSWWVRPHGVPFAARTAMGGIFMFVLFMFVFVLVYFTRC